MTDSTQLPLDGVRILDFTQVMLGPCATQMLGDFGADIIKVERPGAGDLSRHIFGGTSVEATNNPSYLSLNRNKRSIEIDTKSEAGKQIVYDLVKESDVVIDNFRAGVMDQLGLGYEKLKAINPRIIVASGTGFGEAGPYAKKGGQDMLAQAMSGVMAVTADPSIPQSIYPTALCDYTAAMHLVQGVMAALLAREKTGCGQKVSVSLYDSMLAMQMQEAAYWNKYGKVLNWAAMPLAGHFETLDGAIVVVGAFKPNPLQDICKALGIEDLSIAYPDMASQVKNKADLQNTLRKNFALNTKAHWLARLGEQDILCAPVQSLGDALADPQTAINNMLLEIDHPVLGKLMVVGSPVHLSDAPVTVRRTPPQLGEHTEQILREFGLATDHGNSAE